MRRLLLLAALLAVLPSHATPAHAQAGVGLMLAARSAWSPLSLSWAAAYDSDEGITTLAGAVLQWDDLSGNGHTLTPAATGPAYTGSGGPGGHAYLTFASGTVNGLQNTSFTFSPVPAEWFRNFTSIIEKFVSGLVICSMIAVAGTSPIACV